MTKWVYAFGDGKAEGEAEMKNLLGGKGANLAEMSQLGLPVPPGFTITTEVCTYYYANERKLSRTTSKDEVDAALGARRRAHRPAPSAMPSNPLLVSRALGRARLDAGHDGHDPQPRPQRRDRRGLAQLTGDRALRL